MRVVITAAAKADLIAIGDFIQPHNPERAITFVEELLDRCYALADMPRAYPLVPRYEKFGIRRTVHRDYLIFYRVRSEAQGKQSQTLTIASLALRSIRGGHCIFNFA